MDDTDDDRDAAELAAWLAMCEAADQRARERAAAGETAVVVEDGREPW